MHFLIHTHGVALTESMRRQTHEMLELALDRLEDRIRNVKVYLRDTNGPDLDGIDKACRIIVQIRDQEPLIVEDCDEKVDRVIDLATDRLGVVASQRLDALRKESRNFRSQFNGQFRDGLVG